MTWSRGYLSVLVGFVCALGVFAQGRPSRDTTVVFKDGFVIKGKVDESVREIIYDSASGRPFVIPSGNFSIDDHVRRILFTPTNVHKVFHPKASDKAPMQIVRLKSVLQTRDILGGWELTYGAWTDKGEREISVKTYKGTLPDPMVQKIGLLTPHYMMAVTELYRWDLMYFTPEFGPELTRKILLQVFREKKDLRELKDAEKYTQIAAFMLEAGWFKAAEDELVGIIENYPNDKKIAEEMLTKLRQTRTNLYAEGIKKASEVGQHYEAIERLSVVDNKEIQKYISADHRLMAQDLKVKYEKSKTDIEQAKSYLKDFAELAKNAPTWVRACEFIGEELNHDTLGKLETFMPFAEQYMKDRKEKRKPTQSLEEVLAIAATGWLQGNQNAEPDAKNALQMIKARDFLVEYLKTDNELQRSKQVAAFKQYNELPIDVIARLVRMLPPPAPDNKKASTEIQTMTIEAPDSDGGSYLLQLPPDYHPHRAYPVALLLQSGRDKADDMLRRFSEEGAKHGFILAAPLWAGGKVLRAKFEGSAKERAVVIDTLRDLRRRFHVDSDRAYLFGWEDGAKLAFDVGLSHPDQFAGVAVMNGSLQPFTRRFYWPNAQYLPFYIVEGDRNGNNPKLMRDLHKEWNRAPYNCLYFEYKGRSSEWYGMEVAKIVDWMSRKKRHHPQKEMGVASRSGGLGEEFRSSRSSESRFYWLKAEAIAEKNQVDHRTVKWGTNFQPATFQASLSVGNDKDSKGNAKIWNQVSINARGVRGLTLMITPGMMDLSKPLQIRVNGEARGGQRMIQPSIETMLEELYRTGDRQRLVIAAVEIK